MVYTLRFFFPLQNAVCFIILTYLVPVLFTFYIQCVLKLKKNNSGSKRLNQRRRQFSRLLAAKVCASAVVMLDTPCSEVVWRVLTTQFIHKFPLHFPSLASPCASHFNWSLSCSCNIMSKTENLFLFRHHVKETCVGWTDSFAHS